MFQGIDLRAKLLKRSSPKANVQEKPPTVASSDDGLFSIGEEDGEPAGGTFVDLELPGSSTPIERPRKNSASSMASDISFLPRYDSFANVYQLQSDWDESASELEADTDSNLEVQQISKAQIYQAFQRALKRYHRYRDRYKEIATHYRNLERENSKIKSVLVETQDKSLRRVSELREQCTLEQTAKAHLESALRVELDEKQYKIDTLQEKIKILQETQPGRNGDTHPSNVFVDISEELTPSTAARADSNLSKSLRDARAEIDTLTMRVQEMKANAIVFHSKEADLKKRTDELEHHLKRAEHENRQLSARERENNIKIAETKMELHAEIESRGVQIETLKRELDKHEIVGGKSTKFDMLHSQNAKLIEKVEDLTQKSNHYESELLKVEQYKMEIKNLTHTIENLKTKQGEDHVDELRQQLGEEKGVLKEVKERNVELEERLRKIQVENEENAKKTAELKQQLEKLSEENQMLKHTENNSLELEEKLRKIEVENEKNVEKTAELKQYLDELKEENGMLRDTKEKNLKLEEKLRKIEAENAKKTAELKQQLEKLSEEDQMLKHTEKNSLELEEKFRKNQTENEENTKKTAELKQQLEKLSEENQMLKKMEKNSLELEEKFRKIQVENQENVKKTSELKQQLETLSEENQMLKQLDKNNLELEEKLRKMEAENEENVKKTAELKQQLEKLNEENQMLKQMEENNSQLEEKFRKIQAENEENVKKKAQLKQQLEQLSEENQMLKQMEKNYLELEEKLGKIQAENVKKTAELNQHLEELREENRTLKSMDDKNRELEENLRKIQVENEENVKKTAELNQHLEELNEKNRALKDMEERNSQLEEQLRKIRAENEANVEKTAQESQWKEEIDQLNKQIAICEQTISERDTNLATIRDDTKQLLVDLEEKITKKFAREYAEKEEKLTKEFQEKCEQKGTPQSLATIEEKHRKLLHEQEDECRRLKSDLEALNHEQSILKTQMDEEQTRNSDLSEQLREMQEENAKNRREIQVLRDLQPKLEELEKQLEKKQQTIDNLEEHQQQFALQSREDSDKFAREREEFVAKLADYRTIENECSDTQRQNAELNQMVLRLQQTLGEQQQKVDELMCVMERDKNTLKSIESENLDLIRHVSDLEKKIAHLSDQLKINEERLEDAGKQLLAVQSDGERTNGELHACRGQIDELCARNRQLETQEKIYKELLEGHERIKQKHAAEMAEIVMRNEQLSLDNRNLAVEVDKLQAETMELRVKVDKGTEDDRQLSNVRIVELVAENKRIANTLKQVEEEHAQCTSSMQQVRAQLRELEDHLTELNHEKQLLREEIVELKTAPLNRAEKEAEIHGLSEQVTQYRSMDLTNRSAIQFYEGEVEKLTTRNEKLARELDETLVTLNHFSELSQSTESEYLKNVLFNYMMGKESMILARVIAAVCKFDETKTDAILQREQQKQTLLGSLGFI